jgi:hypothetical protein
VIETIVYAAFILSAVVSILQAAAQPVVVPGQLASKQIVCQNHRPC